ncbi:MAG: HlyD family efflux transporter periplasmic adaptor subunit, partial [Planctomycetes bacterium]|nr:HlyD family efflux transporter periplasmic adaptor subunit [Planctomycetota bacterium]
TGGLAVLSLPLRRGGRVVGVVTLERSGEEPFSAEQVEALRLTCDLCCPRLADLQRRDRWVGAKLAGAAGALASAALGRRHTGAKAAGLLIAAAAAYFSLARGTYEIRAPFVLQAVGRRLVCAPFDGQIEEILVEPGQVVRAGDLLGRLRTAGLRRQLSGLEADLFEARKQADAARAAKKWAESQMASARAVRLEQRIALLKEHIDRAELRAPTGGTILKGDLRPFVGSEVEKGRVLFELAPAGVLRAEVSIPEDQVGDLLAVAAGRTVRGTLAVAAYPARKVPCRLGRVFPIARQEAGGNVFTARLAVESVEPWMRPGMEGVARLELGRRRLAWIWTRRLVNRLRLWLWR